MDEIAKRCDPPLTVEWEPFNWQTMRGELDQGRVDVLADIVYATVPRALDMGLTRPFSYVGIACGLVRADETRIKTFQDLENKDITIALAVGWASSEYAFVNLSRPRNDYLMIPAGNDASPQLDAVLNGRADIALNDVPSVVQYVGNHRGRVKALWVDSPPSLVAGAFATRQ
jgi:ABC-type amino acid transport substrate-binding protein